MRVAVITIAALLLLAVGYVLSYAPVYRTMHGSESRGSRQAEWEAVYIPVHWLTDETLFERPLLKWAGLWGVRRQMHCDSYFAPPWHTANDVQPVAPPLDGQ